MEEALIALGAGGDLLRREGGGDLNRDEGGVDHDVLGGAGVDAHAAHRERRGGRVEGLKIDLADLVAVHREGKVRPEALQIQQSRAVADLLIRRETDRDGGVRPPPVQELFEQGHNLGHARLVVRAEEGRAVGGDEGLAHRVLEIGKGRGAEHPAARAEGDIAAVIVGMQLRLYARSGEIRGGVQMRDQADDRVVFPSRGGREKAVGIGVLVRHDALHAEIVHLVSQQPCKGVLFFGARHLAAVFVALGIHLRIAQQSLIGFHTISFLIGSPD